MIRSNKRQRNTAGAADSVSYAAMKRQYNPYKEALLNPISGPLVGVPTSVPIDTHRARLKATTTVTVTGGAITVIANPVFGLCSDSFLSDPATTNVGAINYASATSLSVSGGVVVTNSQYTRSQFAGLTTSSSVRGRVVAACMRICNVSAANTRNGVFTLFTDPQHNTLQGKTSTNVSSDQKATQYNASTADWHTVTYHPVEPDEVDSWVWDPARGPQAGVKTGAYVSPNAADASSADNFPGYMGIWWNGDSVSQTFQIELYIIAEYVGSLVQPLIRDIGVHIDDAQEARETAESMPNHVTPTDHGANHTGHPHSDTHPSRARRVLDMAAAASRQPTVRRIARAAAVTGAGFLGGPEAAAAASHLLQSPAERQQYLQGAQRVREAYNMARSASRAGSSAGYYTPQNRISGSRSQSTPRLRVRF